MEATRSVCIMLQAASAARVCTSSVPKPDTHRPIPRYTAANAVGGVRVPAESLGAPRGSGQSPKLKMRSLTDLAGTSSSNTVLLVIVLVVAVTVVG